MQKSGQNATLANIFYCSLLYYQSVDFIYMFDRQQLEENSTGRNLVLNANHSTGELIPACRAQILRAKRETLRRKINQVANKIFTLKYDTEFQTQQLHQLTQKGQQLLQIAQAKRQKIKADIQQTVRPISSIDCSMNLDLQEIKNTVCLNSQRSTQNSVLTDSKQQAQEFPSETNIQPAEGQRRKRRPRIYDSSPCKVKGLDLKQLSMSQQSLVWKNANKTPQAYQRRNLKMGLVRQLPLQSLLIMLGGIAIITLLI